MDSNLEQSEAFITAARTRNLLSDDQAETLRRQAGQRSLPAAQVAIESGILQPAEVAIAEAFAAPNDLAPGYQLLDVVGYGALGVVYRAHQPRLRRDVAIKAIMQNRLVQQNVAARFQQEGAAIGRLQHPNIVSAFDSGSHRRQLYLVMELVRGIDLRQHLQKNGPLDVATALSIVRQTASGLAHALAEQIIHRDIKPGNLILTEAPAGFDLPAGVPLVKIADFGLARLNTQTDIDDATRLTIVGTALGTPMYCAPEQLSGDAVDHRADIYALGATLVNMLTGKPPLQETKVSKVISAKLTGGGYDAESLPENLPGKVRELIDRMMAPDPNNRFDSYSALIEEIDRIQSANLHDASAKGNTVPVANVPATNVSVVPVSVASADTNETLVTAETSEELSSAVSHSKGSRRKYSIFVFAIVAVIAWVVLLPILFSSPEPSLAPTAWETHLFDGKSVNFVSSRGLWRNATDAEGGVILEGSGSGVKELPVPPTIADGIESAVAMRVGVNRQGSDAVELHFGFAEKDFEQASRLVLRYDKEKVVLGRRQGLQGDFVALSDPVRSPAPDELDSPTYHELKIELHDRYWFAYFNDSLIGTAAANLDAANRYVQLVAPDGSVHFEGASTYGLQRKTL